MNSNSKPENPLLNLFINIILPVMILNKGSHLLTPVGALLVALIIPLIYAVQDYVRRHHKNYVSLLGMVNILLTGGLALMKLEGIWFALKEASLPLVLGLFVLASRWTNNPAARMLFCNPQVMNMELINGKLQEFGHDGQFLDLLKKTTVWFSLSFFISAILNFFIGFRIFQDIDPALEVSVRETILNEQIARMTWMGFAVIAAPLMIFTGILVYLFLRRVSSLTHVPLEQLLKS
ncbi:MAG: VC0807 family protein [Bdellovibrionales bacterium]